MLSPRSVVPQIATWVARRTGRTPEAYLARRDAALAAALDDPALRDVFAQRAALPPGYGRRLDERLVEYPWLLAQEPRGRVLDAGSALNHEVVLARLLPRLEALDVFTLAPEPFASPDPRVAYRYGDLRATPWPDASHDVVCCVSTLEHVGMDNAGYAAAAAGRSVDPRHESRRALRELRRLLRPGGDLLVTVPYGVRADFGWFRQFDREDLEDAIASVDAEPVEVSMFRYGRGGWRRSDLEDAAGARYRDPAAELLVNRDGAIAARAVACLRLRAG